MRILIDAMGGDHAPEAIVRGAIDAAAEFGVQIVLVGRGEAILKSLSALGLDTLPKGVEIANAEDVVEMTDDPANVVRTRRESSMVVGLRMLSEGAGDAFISAGSTGALLSAATLVVKRVKGIRRAALCPEIPTKTGSTLLSTAAPTLSVRRSFSPSSPCWDPSMPSGCRARRSPRWRFSTSAPRRAREHSCKRIPLPCCKKRRTWVYYSLWATWRRGM